MIGISGICQLTKNRTWADVTCIDIFFREFKIMFLEITLETRPCHICAAQKHDPKITQQLSNLTQINQIQSEGWEVFAGGSSWPQRKFD